MQGRVSYYNAERGFGFILVDGESTSLFFHVKNLQPGYAPMLDDHVEFQLFNLNPKGPRAVLVKPLG